MNVWIDAQRVPRRWWWGSVVFYYVKTDFSCDGPYMTFDEAMEQADCQARLKDQRRRERP